MIARISAWLAAGWVVLAGTVQAKEAKVVPRDLPASANSGYVTVSLDAYANGRQPLGFESSRLAVDGVPFDLVTARDGDHVNLEDAGWNDWQKDPSSYYSPYDRLPTNRDPSRITVQIPVADYAAVRLLAVADDDPALTNLVSFRIGAIDGSQRVTYHDFSALVPRASAAGANLITVPTPNGRLFAVSVPLGKAFAQDFADRLVLDVDITKELKLAIRRPDPCRFNFRPLGLPSGVRIYAMTFQIAPVQMTVDGAETGNVFNEPAVPVFRVGLRRFGSGKVGKCSVEAVAKDYYGAATTNIVDVPEPAKGGGSVEVDVPVPVQVRGYYTLVLNLKSGRTTALSRETTFALLPPDTRKYRAESPFGTWDFCGGHFTSDDADAVGPLYVKAGLRYGMFSFSDEERARYGVLKGNDMKADPGLVTNLVAQARTNAGFRLPDRLMIFHETSISGPHITRVPDYFTGRQYRFNEGEQKKFDTLWAQAEATARAIRADLPKTEIYFGNGAPQLLEEFLRRKFPKELLGSRGNEAGNFMRMPEAQPLDFVGNSAGLWMDRTLLDGYGYRDTPLRQCYEMCYPNTNPGNLGLRTQANYVVRHLMHSLAWRIPIIRSCIITDVGNSYYFGNWGAAGLCTARPHIHPKPSYVAMATLTWMLDGATFTRIVPAGSPVVYAFEFKKKYGGYVTCLWTVRGKRAVRAVSARPAAGLSLRDLMGNDVPLTEAEGGSPGFSISAEPVFLTSAGPLERFEPGKAEMEGRPSAKTFLVSALDWMSDWSIEAGANPELEFYNPLSPRRPGDFQYAVAGEFGGQTNALSVKPKLPVPGKEYLPMYSVLKHATGVVLPGEPTGIGLLVNGNGGWGRIIFELEDAGGQRWISLGAEAKGEPTRWLADMLSPEEFAKLKSSNSADWNTDDAWQRSYVNFEGWRYLSFPLPGQYPGEGYHWPYSSQWKFTGDGVVKYPLKFTKLIIALPEKVLHGTEYAPVPRQEIYLKDLMVTYEPVETAFRTE